MRKLQTGDVFELVRLVNKIGIKDEIRAIALKLNPNSTQNEAGFEIVFGLVEKFAQKNSEQEFYAFLSKPLEIDVIEVEQMDPFDLVNNIFEIASVEKWTNFLKLAVR